MRILDADDALTTWGAWERSGADPDCPIFPADLSSRAAIIASPPEIQLVALIRGIPSYRIAYPALRWVYVAGQLLIDGDESWEDVFDDYLRHLTECTHWPWEPEPPIEATCPADDDEEVTEATSTRDGLPVIVVCSRIAS